LLFVGIDGGGSGVRALALDLEQGTLGSCNYDIPADFSSISSAAVLDALERAGQGALTRYGRAADVAFAGVAGCVSEEQRAWVGERLVSAEIARSAAAHHDAYTAWFGATLGRAGVIVMAGTGSSVFMVDRMGAELLTGGYGALFGDEGSGSDLGREFLRAAAAAEDGYGRGTGIRTAVLEALGVNSMREVMSLKQSSEASWLASLVPPFLELVGDGDQIALAILRSRLGCLADQIVVALDACDVSASPPLFGAGSLFANACYLDGLRSAVQERRRDATLRPSSCNSVQGALLAAVARGEGSAAHELGRALEMLGTL
jgi:N-acetylglucosamine kinase-like BadF-type ATPase